MQCNNNMISVLFRNTKVYVTRQMFSYTYKHKSLYTHDVRQNCRATLQSVLACSRNYDPSLTMHVNITSHAPRTDIVADCAALAVW